MKSNSIDKEKEGFVIEIFYGAFKIIDHVSKFYKVSFVWIPDLRQGYGGQATQMNDKLILL